MDRELRHPANRTPSNAHHLVCTVRYRTPTKEQTVKKTRKIVFWWTADALMIINAIQRFSTGRTPVDKALNKLSAIPLDLRLAKLGTSLAQATSVLLFREQIAAKRHPSGRKRQSRKHDFVLEKNNLFKPS